MSEPGPFPDASQPTATKTVRCPHCHSSLPPFDPATKAVVCPGCGSSIQLDPGATGAWLPAEAPRRLGKFEFLEQLGQGAFGTVYKACDTELDRQVAIKIPRAGSIPRPEDLDRFLREARSAAQLRHPGIVAVHDAGQADGTLYLVSEFVQGATLAEQLSAKRFSFRQAAALVAEVAEALAYAHAQGVIHRDIKPSNIMLDLEGKPHVMDFGLAKRAAEEGGMTLEGQVLGTPAFMAPEQARGEVKKVDARSDVYSLGVVLYELLAGELPFRGQARMLLVQVMQEEPRPPRKLNDRIPKDLETICLKAMAKEPGRRYQAAQHLADDLRRWLKGEPIQARPVGQGERLWRWCRRNPLLATTTGLAAAALLAVTVVSTFLAIAQAKFAAQQTQSNEDLRREKDASNRLASELDSKLLELRKNSALAAVERGQSLIDQGQLHRGLLWLTRGLELAPGDDGDFQHSIRTNLASLRGELCSLRATFSLPLGNTALAFSPEGRTVAFAGSDNKGEARLFDSATGKQIGPPLQRPVIRAVAFSPDGKTLVAAGLNGIQFLDVVTGKETGPRMNHAQGDFKTVAYSPDGKTIVTSGDSVIQFWDVVTGKEIGPPLEPLEQQQGYGLTVVAFSQDGKTIATGSWFNGSGQIRLWDAATRKPIGQPLGYLDAPVYSLAFSPDSKTLATTNVNGGGQGECRLWDAGTGKPRGDPLLHPAGIVAVTFSPDGKTIATAGGFDMKARLWDAVGGKLKGNPLEHEAAVWAVAFSPDGRLLLTSGGGFVRLWGADTGQPVGEPLAGPEVAGPVPFSPDGQSILIPGPDKTARLWSLPLGRRARPPLSQPGGVSALALRGDGKRMLVRSGNITMGEIRLWDVVLNKPVGHALLHQGWYFAGTLSPDGKTILIGSGFGAPLSAQLWDAQSLEDGEQGVQLVQVQGRILAVGKPIGKPLQVSGQIYAVRFSPDGKTILIGGDDATGQKGQVQLGDAVSGKAIGTPLVFRGQVRALAFSSDGKTFLTGSGDEFGGQSGEVRLWDASAMTPIGDPLLHNGRVAALAFSPDDKIIASGSRDRTARLWSAATGKPIGLPLPHGGEVNAVIFSPDGKIVATASDDKTVRLWNVTTGLPLGTPMRHQGSVNSVAFTPDGSTLITGSDDKTIRFWRAPVPLPGDVAQVKAWAELTSGMALSPEGTTSLLEAFAWNSMHEKLASGGRQPPDFGNPFMAAPGQGLTYDLHLALSCMESADWQAALWHLDREIRTGAERRTDFQSVSHEADGLKIRPTPPDAWLAYVLRTKARVQLARLDQAAADIAKAFELGPPDQVLLWYGNFADESTNEEQWQTAAWYEDRLVAARPHDAALYLDRVRAYLKRKRWKEDIKDYDEAVKQKPNDPQVWREKANFDITHGRWKEGAKAWAKVLELDPNEHYEWYYSAALHLLIGDVDGYRRHCREMLSRFAGTKEAFIAERTAKVCLLLPDAAADQKLIQRLAQQAVTGTEKHYFYGYFQLAKGMAEYRAGHFEQSMEWLRGSQKAHIIRERNFVSEISSQAPTKAMAHLFLAMAQYRLGQADEARETLARATWLIDAVVRKWKPDEANMGELDWFMALIVRKEAEAVIGGKKK